ncbi:MAG: ribosome small subunit-dependent GTPase A [Candidatus Edwardsbacteria bacterium]|nr:ribosome small subunit-dependent GTPase A [Candidatus Edwardsbacteria bacterium]
MDLKNIGWDPFFEEHLKQIKNKAKYDYDFLVGRVSAVHTNLCQVLTGGGEVTAQVSGKMRDKINNETTSPNGETPEPAFPAVGDWVMMIHDQQHNSGIIRMVLPRKTKFSRNAAGATSQEQVIAANIDYAFIVAALNADFNPSRIERYLVTTWNSGAVPVILLNKSDLCTEVDAKIVEMEKTAVGVSVHAISAAKGEGLEQLSPYLQNGRTSVFIGSSGAGKSTIINRLLGRDVIKVVETSDYKDKGRHTTTSREMYLLEGGGIVIDTPGMRELQLWEGEQGLSETFDDIEQLAAQCRFNDCRHQDEPDCAVRLALEKGEVAQVRFKNFLKLQRELRFQEARHNAKVRMEQSKRWKAIAKTRRHINKDSTTL